MDWNLGTCSRRGHITYEPTEKDLAARLQVATPAGPAWRCLRCWTYVVGEPNGSGPADAAPAVPRGAALRDQTITRLLALERVIHGIFFLGLALAVLLFRNREGFLRSAYDADLAILTPVAEQMGWHVDHSRILRLIDEVLGLTPTTLVWIGLGVLVYAGIQFTEAVGLWLGKRWGEYFTVIATSFFLPLEIYELTERVTWLRVLLLLVNLAALAWLVWSKRLFGARGGAAAQQALHEEQNLLTVERAALSAAAAQ